MTGPELPPSLDLYSNYTAPCRFARVDRAHLRAALGPRMATDLQKRIPKPGDKIIHRFRGQLKPVTATVVEVDAIKDTVKVRYRGTIYNSLAAAARAANSGKPVNGWRFWGLKP